MRVLTTARETVEACHEAPRPMGLVPTMGALHEGHLSLVREARQHNVTVLVSIFVNPTQFGPSENFVSYPQDIQRDLALLEREKVDIVFAPQIEEVFPPGFDTFVQVGQVAHRLEGEHRPGHLRGVATVVTKLFAITRPDQAYFGQKDGQQAAVIRRLTIDLNLGVAVIVLPTKRDPSGLAMSSRNINLDQTQQEAATVLYRALCAARHHFQAGERDAHLLRQAAWEVLNQEPTASPDYVSVADRDTLEELEQVDRPAMVSLAVRIGPTRLVDNILLHP